MTIDHGRSGPVRVGDIVCGFREGHSWIWIYSPEEIILTHTS